MNFREADRTWTQIGITSFVASAGCQSGNPSGFTRTRSILNWICFVTSGNVGCGFYHPSSTKTTTTSKTPKPPSCPSFIPVDFECKCTSTSCHLFPIPTKPAPTPECPSIIPVGFICKCNSSSCELVCRPFCPPVIPPGFICICTNDSCDLFPLGKPSFPFFFPNINICVCSAGKENVAYINKV